MAHGMCPRMQARLANLRPVAHGRIMPIFRTSRRSTQT